MVRRRWLIGQVALVGALVALALPSSSSALSAVFITLTSTGASPATLTIPAGTYPVWVNQDTVAHTVTFSGICSVELAPGAEGTCNPGPGNVVGDFPYTVDGTTQASVSVAPEWRGVTLKAERHGFRRGSRLRLHGFLFLAIQSPPVQVGARMPVTVFERPRGHHLWYRLKTVMAKPLSSQVSGARASAWQLWVRPHGSTTYKVVADSQPKTGQYWQQARSGSFGVYVRHRPQHTAAAR